MYAEVAVPVPVNDPFSYEVPTLMVQRAIPGMRVIVPFGSRRLTGYVVGTRDRPPKDVPRNRIKPLLDCLDPQPLVPPAVLGVTRWVADSYMSSWGEALRAAVPASLTSPRSRRVEITEAGAKAGPETLPRGIEGSARGILEALAERGVAGGLSAGRLAREVEDSGVHATLYALADAGLVEVRDEWSGEVAGRWQRAVRIAGGTSLERAREETDRAPAQRRVVEILWERRVGDSGILQTELAEAADCSPSVIESLDAKGVVERFRTRVARSTSEGGWSSRADGAGTFELTAEQRRALDAVIAGLSGEDRRPVLIHGVTGSGKTEVYLRAAKTVVEADRSAILLVPEIGLTPQLEHRARAVLGEGVEVLHSGLPTSDRLQAWWRLRRGDAKVAIGPRSSVFAPVEDVGLVVVDEEQDGAYKQDERPRYHGRDAALARAEMEGAMVVMGSATPAVETFEGARDGTYRLRQMSRRVERRELPDVEVVDMRREWQESGRTLLSRTLEEGLESCLRRDQQALVLLNRRGFAAALLCRLCGERLQCSECAVSMTLHRASEALLCHYCDRRIPVPEDCPHCGADALHDLGHGTERLQRALDRRFAGARVGRFDADETRRVGAHARILGAFSRGEWDVLVGTQMLAKGHDFPGVTLVGIVAADGSLSFPDFRAAERTFQLLTQMAGRAGRGEAPGRVIVQAFSPDHYAVEAATRHDYGAFFREEIEYRRRLGYPPFASLISCVCRDGDALAAKEDADRLARAIREVGDDRIDVLGPASAPLSRLRGRHRVQVLVKGPDRDAVRRALVDGLGRCGERGSRPRDLVMDVDPMSLM